MTDLKNDLKAWDLAIRYGEAGKVRAALRKLNRQKIPREHYAAVAQLAERCGMPQTGIRLLLRVVRPSRRGPVVATPAEKIEYAGCLVRLGGMEEALAILDSVAQEKSHRALLYRTFALASHWNYADTIPVLEKYLAFPKLDNYRRLVGEVNLAAALVFERKNTQATSLLRKIVHEASVQKLPLLLANGLELSAEHFILLGRFDEAEKLIEKAKSLLVDTGTVYEFLIRKWQLINDFMSGKTQSLTELQTLAYEKHHWETLRDCDRFSNLKSPNPELARHLYFGTPYDAFRKQLRPVEVPATYDWKLGGEGKQRALLDLITGEATVDNKITARLNTGKLLHRLLCILASDFYRPYRLTALHARLHPGEFYHPEATPKKMHQALMELREWLSEARFPLEIIESKHSYLLRATKPLSIRVSAGERLGKARLRELDQIQELFGQTPFSTSNIETKLSLPRRTVQRLLQDWVESGELTRSGSGGYTRYQIAATKK